MIGYFLPCDIVHKAVIKIRISFQLVYGVVILIELILYGLVPVAWITLVKIRLVIRAVKYDFNGTAYCVIHGIGSETVVQSEVVYYLFLVEGVARFYIFLAFKYELCVYHVSHKLTVL